MMLHKPLVTDVTSPQNLPTISDVCYRLYVEGYKKSNINSLMCLLEKVSDVRGTRVALKTWFCSL